MPILVLSTKLLLSAAMSGFNAALWEHTPSDWLCCADGKLCGQRPMKFKNRRAVFIALTMLFFISFFRRNILFCFALCPVLTALFQLSVSDVLYRVLQDEWEIFIAALGIIGAVQRSGSIKSLAALLSRRIAAALLFILLWILFAAASAALKSEIPLGFGDAKLLAACSILLGGEKTLLSAAFAFILAGAYAAILLILKKVQKKDRISFGPFICLGILCCLLPAP